MEIHDADALEVYTPDQARYAQMMYRRCGKSGIRLPAISLGLWHNFGHTDSFRNGRKMCRSAFDMGITHFDLANNYGPPFGAAEENFGRILKKDLGPYRDELIISSKAGWDMWPGPYGNFGSKKYLVASLDQSLKRMGLDYVDIFYHHRPDPDTPLEETMMALDQIVRQGKALYVGISQYNQKLSRKAFDILNELRTPCLIHQPRYSMMDRWVENGLLDVLEKYGVGSIAFSPLEQGILTKKYLKGFPENSRAIRDGRYLSKDQISKSILNKVQSLNDLAKKREQTLAQMAISWLLKDARITSVLVGASSVKQLEENVDAVKNINFSKEELQEIESILAASE